MLNDDQSDLAPPDPRLLACVVIPARNEEVALPATLRAFIGQRDRQGQPLDPRQFEVIVLANNCQDRTAEVARHVATASETPLVVHVVERTFPAAQSHIGTARRWLMDLGCQRLEAVGQPQSLIATTDADTLVSPTWIAANLAESAAGADAVAGMIDVDLSELRDLGGSVRRGYLADRVYRRLKLELEAILDPNPLDPYPRHDFHGGASLAVQPRMYRRVGGLPPRVSQEDVGLAEALWRVDARFVHSPRVRVCTSGRLRGRATGGQSQALACWQTNQPDEVLAGSSIAAELRDRQALRRLFVAKTQPAVAAWRPYPSAESEMADRLAIDRHQLREIMHQLPTFGGWLEAITRISPRKLSSREAVLVPISEAIQELRRLVRSPQAE